MEADVEGWAGVEVEKERLGVRSSKDRVRLERGEGASEPKSIVNGSFEVSAVGDVSTMGERVDICVWEGV